LLESGVCFFQYEQPLRWGRLPGRFDGRNASGNRNESFFAKNGRKQGFLSAKFFAIAFERLLVYGIMVMCAGRKLRRTMKKIVSFDDRR